MLLLLPASSPVSQKTFLEGLMWRTFCKYLCFWGLSCCSRRKLEGIPFYSICQKALWALMWCGVMTADALHKKGKEICFHLFSATHVQDSVQAWIPAVGTVERIWLHTTSSLLKLGWNILGYYQVKPGGSSSSCQHLAPSNGFLFVHCRVVEQRAWSRGFNHFLVTVFLFSFLVYI